LALQNDWVIPPEIAYQLSVLASQLEALAQPEIRTDPESTTRMPVAAAWEKPGEEQQIAAAHVGIHKNRPFEQPTSEPSRFMSLFQNEFRSGRSNSPHRIVRRQIFQKNELFWRTATVFALAAILFLLLGTSVHRLSPLPSRLELPSEVLWQKAPFQRRIALESSAATKPVAPTALADQSPASGKASSSPQNAVVKPTGIHSTYASETDFVAEQNTKVASEVQNRIRADRRLQMTQAQVRASNGIVTLSGDVGSDAERVAAAQDAADIGGVDVLVNSLRVITNPHSPTGTLQKPSAVAPIVSRSAAESSSASPVSTSAMKAPARVPEQITVPYGAVLAVRLNETLSSGLNQPGDTFLARLASPIVIGDRVVVPEGAGIKGNIVDARNARRLSGRSALVIEVTHLAYNGRTYELRSSQYSKQGASRNAYAAAAITGGTGVGAILGTVLGRGRGAAIGAVLGAAAGTGVQAVTKPAPAELSAESTLSLRLETPLKVIPSSTLQQAQSAGPDFSQDPFSSDDRPVLKQRVDTLPDASTPGSSPASNKGSQLAPSPLEPPHN
jgi:hypothetical protein